MSTHTHIHSQRPGPWQRKKERAQVSLIAIEWSNHFWCSSYLIVWELCCALNWILYWKFKHFYPSSWTKILPLNPSKVMWRCTEKNLKWKWKKKQMILIKKKKIKQNIIIDSHCIGRDRQARADIYALTVVHATNANFVCFPWKFMMHRRSWITT